MPGGSWFEHVNGDNKQPAVLFVASNEPALKCFHLFKKWGRDPAGDAVESSDSGRDGEADPGRAGRHGLIPLFERFVSSRSNSNLLSHFDCPGGGQVWVEGTTLYIGHMRCPAEQRSSTWPIRAIPHPCNDRHPEGWHSHKVRASNGIMIVNHEKLGQAGGQNSAAK